MNMINGTVRIAQRMDRAFCSACDDCGVTYKLIEQVEDDSRYEISARSVSDIFTLGANIGIETYYQKRMDELTKN